MSWTRPNTPVNATPAPVAAGWIKPDGSPSAKPWPSQAAIGAMRPLGGYFVNGRAVIVQSCPNHPAATCKFYAQFSPRGAHDSIGWGETEFNAVAELEELDNARIAAGL